MQLIWQRSGPGVISHLTGGGRPRHHVAGRERATHVCVEMAIKQRSSVMDMPLLFILAGVTFLLVIGFTIWSKRATEKRMEASDTPKSTLATDKDNHGKPADVE
jgi:hypothetical protein